MKEVLTQFLNRNNIDLQNQNVCVGISTGVDSTVLLHSLLLLQNQLQLNIILCHVNHGKREQSNIEEQYIKELAQIHPNIVLKGKYINTNTVQKILISLANERIRLYFLSISDISFITSVKDKILPENELVKLKNEDGVLVPPPLAFDVLEEIEKAPYDFIKSVVKNDAQLSAFMFPVFDINEVVDAIADGLEFRVYEHGSFYYVPEV